MYTTKAKIENYLLKEIDASFDSQINNWIKATTREIESITKRVFESVTEERLFDGNNKRTLPIDDAVEITKLEISNKHYPDSGDYEEEDDYILLPNNYDKKGIPATKIHLRSGYFNRGRQNVKINGKWGYSETVPEDIEFVATVMTAGIINNQLEDNVKDSEKIGDYTVSYKDNQQKQDIETARSILDSYKKYEL